MSQFTTALVNGQRHRALQHAPWQESIVQHRPMSRRYMVVNPTELSALLVADGASVQIVDKLHDKGSPSRWKQALQVTMPGRVSTANDDPYDIGFAILCDHQGKASVRIVPNVRRLWCANVFESGVVWSARHDDVKKLDVLFSNPMGLLTQLGTAQAEMVQNLDKMREVEPALEWFTYLGRAVPRVGSKIMERWDTVYSNHRNMWGLLQSATQVKLPGGQRIAQECLGEGLEMALKGRLPNGLSVTLARKDVNTLFS